MVQLLKRTHGTKDHRERLLSAISRVVQERRDPNILGADLSSAWLRYVALFGQQPHGTIEQMKALCELLPKRAALAEVGQMEGK